MELLSVNRARSIWLIPLVDLNPFGRETVSRIPDLVQKYNFFQVPTKYEDFDLTKGVKFLGGKFSRNEAELVVELTVFSDGLIADTRSSTDDSDTFLDELLTWQTEKYGNRPYREILRRKLYLSELWVRPDKPLNALNPRLEAFSKRLTSLISNYSDLPLKYEMSGISFLTEPGLATPPAPFKLERALEAPFGENRYWAIAPLQTAVHLEMLNEIEKMLIG